MSPLFRSLKFLLPTNHIIFVQTKTLNNKTIIPRAATAKKMNDDPAVSIWLILPPVLREGELIGRRNKYLSGKYYLNTQPSRFYVMIKGSGVLPGMQIAACMHWTHDCL